jgi:hypothetical protein
VDPGLSAGSSTAPVGSSGAVLLTLDHIIIRTADPQATLRELSDRLGAPVLAEVEEVSGLASGIVRAGDIDIEVVRVGAETPARPHGYGLGFTADVGLRGVAAALRANGFATSAAASATAGGRSWRAIQVHGLLPDPFPVPASTRKPGFFDRAAESAAGVLTKVPALARAATRKAGASMVVVTEYGFDAAAWRAKAGHGPDVFAVEVGTGGNDWTRLPLEAGPLQLRLDGPPGIRCVTLDGDAEAFMLGTVAFEFNAAA